MNLGPFIVGLVFLLWTWDCFKPKPKPKLKKTLGQAIDQLIEDYSKKDK